ncbi:hypothetical protein [Chryseobacterium sp. GP-SGM7]|uniref:hypothetical protein n=1 Tax=Chryseobacterium sp. GP-SGM7 TaxID=3411323 RepID=UPI003B93E270
MKTYVLITMVAGALLMSCSKEKTDLQTSDSTVSNTLRSDTSMALPPSDSTIQNAPLNAESSTITNDSAGTSVNR